MPRLSLLLADTPSPCTCFPVGNGKLSAMILQNNYSPLLVVYCGGKTLPFAEHIISVLRDRRLVIRRNYNYNLFRFTNGSNFVQSTIQHILQIRMYSKNKPLDHKHAVIWKLPNESHVMGLNVFRDMLLIFSSDSLLTISSLEKKTVGKTEEGIDQMI